MKAAAAGIPNMDVWVLALPFFSHAICISQLAEKIAQYGLTVTLFLAENDMRRLIKSPTRMVQSWALQGLDISIRTFDAQSALLAGPIRGMERFVTPFKDAEDSFRKNLEKAVSEGSKPTCVITDFFMPTALDTASEFGIPAWMFIPFSCTTTASITYLEQLSSKGILTLPRSHLDRTAQEAVISLPGLPLIRICEMSENMFEESPLYEMVSRRQRSMEKTDVILLSCFEELEPRGLQCLKTLLEIKAVQTSSKIPHIWPVGPLIPFLSYTEKLQRNKTGDGEVHPCIKFLDSQAPSSVLYVSFGTDVWMSQEQIAELVFGLETSHSPFLCVLHPPSDEDAQVEDVLSIFPADFVERIKSRSLFVKWAPQLEVLSHPSTTAFISHCGQNSLLESVSLGVPILAWPRQYDQFINCRFLVDEAQIAVEVCPGLLPLGLVDRKDVERSVNTLFHTEEGTAVRNRALKMKQQAEETVGENGSSRRNMLALVALIQDLAKKDLETASSPET